MWILNTHLEAMPMEPSHIGDDKESSHEAKRGFFTNSKQEQRKMLIDLMKIFNRTLRNTFSHVLREANGVADELAREGVSV